MKLRILYIIALLLVGYGCENTENDFDDFTEQNVYFPFQYPIRTISLQEDSRVDNSVDLEKAFNIGISLGGVRSNDIDRVVTIALAPELVTGAFFDSGATNSVLLMPSNYYTLASTEVIIPKGSFSGTVKVQLTDAFFNDPLSLSVNYVIPLVIVSSNTTGILKGVTATGVTNPDRRLSSDWEAGFTPKDFTLFGVKFINKFHGKYLHKGKDDTLTGIGGNVVSSDIYSEQYIEKNFLTDLYTLGLTKSTVNRLGRSTGSVYNMDLTISPDGNVIVSSATGGLVTNGTGKFVSRQSDLAESWGGEKRKTFFLDYTYLDNGVYHRCKDTLVFRNDELKFEEFNVTIKP